MKRLVKKILKNLILGTTEPLITINISRRNLLHNLEVFKRIKPENTLIPVLKSNAYGHGLIEISNILKNKVDAFIVDSYFEAEILRNSGIKNHLITIGYVRPESIRRSRLKNISYTITSLESLLTLNFPIKIHLKVDTGMNRQGVLIEELDQAFNYIKNNKNIILEGICSHLADADNTNSDFTLKQIDIWNSLVEKTKKEFRNLKYYHLSNTHGHKFSEKISANSSRLGIGLYGLADISNILLKPVMEITTIVSGVKKIKKGSLVGYNNTYLAEKDMVIATIPFGYYEGLDRQLSNKGFVKIRDIDCPILGRISMNITTIDVSNVSNIKIGEKVIVISKIPSDKNSIISMTKLSERISYELVIKIPTHLKRVVVD